MQWLEAGLQSLTGAEPVLKALAVLSIRIALLLVVTAALGIALRRAAARVRYVVWGTALVGVLLVPVVSRVLPSFRIPLVPAIELTGPWTTALGVIWFIGSLIALVWLIAGLWRMRAITRRATPLSGPGWNPIVTRLTLEATARRPYTWLISDEIATPMTWGILNPVILLPSTAEAWTAQRREVVLLHELVHAQRGDWLVQLLALLACSIHWFNPLMWYAVRCLAIERERACDDAVIASGTTPSVYAEHLLEVAHIMTGRATPVATLSMARHSQLEGRLVSVLNQTGQTRRGTAPATVITITLVLLVAAMHPVVAAPRGSTAGIALLPGRDGDLAVAWTEQGMRYRFAAHGGVETNQSRTDVVRIAADASVLMESAPVHDAGGTRSRLLITADDDGALRYAWTIDGEPAEFDDDARGWMRFMIARSLDRVNSPESARYRTVSALTALFDRMVPIDRGMRLAEERLDQVEDAKAPLYERVEELQATIEPLIRERDELETQPDRTEALSEVVGRLASLKAELNAVHEELDPWVTEWNDLAEDMEHFFDQLDPIYEKAIPVIRGETAVIIESGLLSAGLTDPAAGVALTRLDLDAILDDLLDPEAPLTLEFDVETIWINVDPDEVRPVLLLAVDASMLAHGIELSESDRATLDATIDRVRRTLLDVHFIPERK